MTDAAPPAQWRQHAAEARAMAAKSGDAAMRRILLEIAADYERLAELTEKRQG